MTEVEGSKEKVEKEEEAPEFSRKDAMRKEAEEMMKVVFSEEARQHLIKAGSELLLAFEVMMPKSRFPEDTKRHYQQMRREFLLTAKSIIDSRLEVVEGKEASQGLKKIEID
ncbi:MAG: hypothetical protein GKC03_06825 [Methanomassiliicoccales archaeon]|nr:hypothetical protein [Methanomassiliicoccales archaeon]NYT14756.1 hypothetical protein [Methanomassiliicoccales archaeon]